MGRVRKRQTHPIGSTLPYPHGKRWDNRADTQPIAESGGGGLVPWQLIGSNPVLSVELVTLGCNCLTKKIKMTK